MCVNDILCQGAKPLFFLDYLATGKLKAESAALLVKGITDGCKLSNMPLLGGETAEMPGFYANGEYDMAGFAVGVVDEPKIISGQSITEGDVMIGIASSGIHSNGYSLVRKVLLEHHHIALSAYVPELKSTLGEVLLTPTKIYVKSIMALLESVDVKGMVHMTGGGFFENIPRVLPSGLNAHVKLGSWNIPPIFDFIMEKGNIAKEEMFGTFNMGVGFICVVSKESSLEAIEILKANGESVSVIGEIVKGEKGVTLCES
jgi:phosphoribosylformylglycinamidine cyclo-ligase